MNINEITQLIEHFDASKATKLQLKLGDTELVLESTALQGASTQQSEAGNLITQFAVSRGTGIRQEISDGTKTSAREVTGGKMSADSEKCQLEPEGIPVKAPLVGTFYCAPSPEEKPFVSEGQTVKKGDVIGIIEAMKLMNEITAPEDGVVKVVLAQNGNMVEYGEVLMVLE